MRTYDTVIAGAGFAGIYTAWRLAKAGQSVAIVEAADKIGGILQSRQWREFWLDNGTHNFDIRTPIGEEFYSDILRENILIFEDQTWASTTDRTWTAGFEMPDFSLDDPAFCKQVLSELDTLKQKAPSNLNNQTYMELYKASYGSALQERLYPMMRKFTGSKPDEFSIDARESMRMFSRPKLGSDAQMAALKSSDLFWNQRLGVSLQCSNPEFIEKNVRNRFAYPAQKGMKGFCDAAHNRLVQLGVDIFLSSEVYSISGALGKVHVSAGHHSLIARKLFWSLPELLLTKIMEIDVDLTSYAVPVGTCFFAFEVPVDKILGPDYLQDYSLDRTPFRYNRQGLYSNQINSNGHSLVMAEVPCHPKDIAQISTRKVADRVFQDMCKVGYLEPDTKNVSTTFWGHPVAYTIPKVDWQKTYNNAQAQIRARSKDVIGIELGYRGRLNFMKFYEKKLQHQLMG